MRALKAGAGGEAHNSSGGTEALACTGALHVEQQDCATQARRLRARDQRTGSAVSRYRQDGRQISATSEQAHSLGSDRRSGGSVTILLCNSQQQPNRTVLTSAFVSGCSTKPGASDIDHVADRLTCN